MKPKKKFKDTVVGKGLSAFAGLISPVLGNLISGSVNIGEAIGHIVKDESLTSEQKEQLKSQAHRLEIEEFEAGVRDRESARSREIAVVNSGGSDLLFKTIGWGVLGAFIIVVLASIGIIDTSNIKDRDFLMIAVGAVFSQTSQIVSYYFGSSKGSADKNRLISNKL